MNHVETIDDVIQNLKEIINWSYQKKSQLGYFPALYLKVTQQVKEGIQEGLFDDGARMEKLDVDFAKRYLNALDAYRDDRPLTRSWGVTFEAAENSNMLILQHLLLGINAHINLDLGITTATIIPGADISSVENDFNRINEILSRLTNTVQAEIDKLSPWIAVLDWIGGRKDEQFADFSLEVARKEAWRFAKNIVGSEPQQRQRSIQMRDGTVAKLSGLIEGRWFIRPLIHFVRYFESKDVRRNIEVLHGTPISGIED